MRRRRCDLLASLGRGTQRHTRPTRCSVRCSRKSRIRRWPVASPPRNRHSAVFGSSRTRSPGRHTVYRIARFRTRRGSARAGLLRGQLGSTPPCRRRLLGSISSHNRSHTRERPARRSSPLRHAEYHNIRPRGTGYRRLPGERLVGIPALVPGWCMRRTPGTPLGCCAHWSCTRAHRRSARCSLWRSGPDSFRSRRANSCSLRGTSARVRTSHRHCNRQTASRSGPPSPARSRRERKDRLGKQRRSFLRRRAAPPPPAGWSCTLPAPTACSRRK